MRFIPTRIHGYLDYAIGILLIVAPWLFAFARGGAETWVPVSVGTATVLYSMVTDYELGLVRRISMPTHLMFDAVGGVFLAVSPWLFGFADFVSAPHLLFGLIEVVAAVTTDRVPYRERATGL